jgi:aldose 1-epimerase
MKQFVIFALVLMLFSCTEKKVAVLDADTFSFDYEGKKIELYTLQNDNGMICQFTNFGARIVSVFAPDKNGNFADVIVGYGSGKDYVEKQENFFGAIIGRYGNRIAKGVFSIDSVQYQLETNDGPNHLHGGTHGFYRQMWNVESVTGSEIVFSLVSPDMDSGYPGTVNVKVKYTLTADNELKIEYFATSDKKTILNLTNHSFFNLKDGGRSSVGNHLMYINANKFTPVDETLIPTGELVPVAGTPMDFTTPTAIDEHIDADYEQLKLGHGYDHNWVLNTQGDVTKLAAKVTEPETGRVLEVYTNEPGIQFYGGNFLNGKSIGKNDIAYAHRSAFCLETQHFPDSPNKPEFPSVILEPGQKYYSECIYKFITEK